MVRDIRMKQTSLDSLTYTVRVDPGRIGVFESTVGLKVLTKSPEISESYSIYCDKDLGNMTSLYAVGHLFDEEGFFYRSITPELSIKEKNHKTSGQEKEIVFSAKPTGRDNFKRGEIIRFGYAWSKKRIFAEDGEDKCFYTTAYPIRNFSIAIKFTHRPPAHGWEFIVRPVLIMERAGKTGKERPPEVVQETTLYDIYRWDPMRIDGKTKCVIRWELKSRLYKK